MTTLAEVERQDRSFNLDELVEVANDLLPQFLPAEEERGASRKVRDEVNPRLVRHYASAGLIEDAERAGREARYRFVHLLQLLLVRRLLTEGYPAAAVKKMLAGKAAPELRALLHGGPTVSVTARSEANPALEYLERIRRQRSVLPAPAPAAPPAPKAPLSPAASPVFAAPGAPVSPPLPPRRWVRMEVVPGLEMHLREDFSLPSSPQERDNLLAAILEHLKIHKHTKSNR